MVFSARAKAFLLLIICSFYAGSVFATEISFHGIDKEFVLNTSADTFILNDYVGKRPPAFAFTRPEQVTDCELNQKPCDPQKDNALVFPPGTHGAFNFNLTFKKNGVARNITIKFLEGLPSFEVEGQSKLDSPVYFTPHRFILVIAPDGEIFFARKYSYLIEDFKPHVLNGKFYYSFLRESNSKIFNAAAINGERVLLDENFNMLKVLPWKNIDLHEFLLLGTDHYMFTAYENKTDKLGSCLINQFVREYKNGRLVFEYSTEEMRAQGLLYDAPETLKTKDIICHELFHLNSIQVISENLLMIGLGRGSLLLVDKKKKKPVWIFGGLQDQFSLTDQLTPFLSHTPHYDTKTGRLLVFANSTRNDKKNSQVIEYVLNTRNKTVEKTDFPAPMQFFAKVAGSVYETNGVYSVGLGERKEIPWDFIEYYEKKPTYKIGFRPLNAKIGSYRVYRN